MGFGRCARTTHVKAQQGPGQATHDTRKRHTGADFLTFCKRIARGFAKGEVHLTLDNVSTHETPAVEVWLAQHPRFHLQFTLTSASWTNHIGAWFGILTRQAHRRGSFDGERALVETIDAFASERNDQATPFVWIKTADHCSETPIACQGAIGRTRRPEPGCVPPVGTRIGVDLPAPFAPMRSTTSPGVTRNETSSSSRWCGTPRVGCARSTR